MNRPIDPASSWRNVPGTFSPSERTRPHPREEVREVPKTFRRTSTHYEYIHLI